MAKSWLNIPGLYYSYGACEDDQTFPKADEGDLYDEKNTMVTLSSYAAYTKDTCPYRVQPTGCECIGSNDALGEYEKARHGQDYGKWCAAWEDGKIDPNATAVGTSGARGATAIHMTLLHPEPLNPTLERSECMRQRASFSRLLSPLN